MTPLTFLGRQMRLVSRIGLLIGIAVVPSIAHAQEKGTKEAIVKAWKERQERIKSATFEWVEERTDTAGSIKLRTIEPKLRHLKDKVIPPKDTTTSARSAASLSGNKLRYEYTTSHWYPSKEGYADVSYLAVFDGRTSAILHGPSPEREWHQGQIRNEVHHVDSHNLHLQPVLMTFRAMTPWLRVHDIANFELTGVRTKIGEINCLELAQSISVDLENRMWVDPSRDFVLTRCMTLRQGKVVNQLDVRYESGADKESLPKTWSVTFNRPDGTLLRFYDARLVSCELNASVPGEKFEIVFPLGTRVDDEKEKREWIVMPDGSGDRPVAKSEARLSYNQLVGRDPGTLEPASRSSHNVWFVASSLALTVAGLAAILLVYRRVVVQRRKR